MSGELGGKRLELLKETVATLSRVAVLWDPENIRSDAQRSPRSCERPRLAAPFDGGE